MIEEEQRAIRKGRKEKSESWEPRLFDFVIPSGNDVQGTTAKDPQHTDGVLDQQKGHWMFK